MAKLTPESPRLFRPTLAAWIGLNESIFLEQLNFILTEVENRGKFVDGKKWYRDTPRAFMVTYFPFWDEGTVKRTIANLRADALILARSDLNEDHRDRSLWYTINHPALERLAGPVARITGKSDKRKEARKSRKPKPDNYPDYAKVQNVLMTEVQNVPDAAKVQSVPIPQVQNVPTPKEFLKEVVLDDKALPTFEILYNRWLGNLGKLAPRQVELFGDYYDEHPEWVSEIIDTTIGGKPGNPWQYFVKIINSWVKNGKPAEVPIEPRSNSPPVAAKNGASSPIDQNRLRQLQEESKGR